MAQRQDPYKGVYQWIVHYSVKSYWFVVRLFRAYLRTWTSTSCPLAPHYYPPCFVNKPAVKCFSPFLDSVYCRNCSMLVNRQPVGREDQRHRAVTRMPLARFGITGIPLYPMTMRIVFLLLVTLLKSFERECP